MIANIGAISSQKPVTGALGTSERRPAHLPEDSFSASLSISPEAKKLLAARTVISKPLAVVALSSNPQVNKLAMTVYISQQNQRLLDMYGGASATSNGAHPSTIAPLAIAAVSDNPQVDKLATTVYAARVTQQMLDAYKSVGIPTK